MRHFLIIGCISFVLLELTLRVIFPLPQALHFNRATYSNLYISPITDRQPHLSNSSFTWSSIPDKATFTHKLNLYGFRDQQWQIQKDPTVTRIAFIGDSLVEGVMTEHQNTIPEYFSRLAGSNVRTMNLGVIAAGARQYISILRDAYKIFHPDQVIIVLYANDFPLSTEKSNPPTVRGEPPLLNKWIPHTFSLLNNLREHHTLPKRWGDDAIPFFAPTPHASNPWSDMTRRHNFEKFVRSDIASDMRQGNFNPFQVNSYQVMEHLLTQPAGVESFLNEIALFSQQHTYRYY